MNTAATRAISSQAKTSKPLRFIRRLEGMKRLGLAPSTYYDWSNPKSPRYKASLPKLVRYGGTRGMTGFFEDEIEKFIDSFRDHDQTLEQEKDERH